ncbi:RNA polymerase sigma factor [Chitinophaga alhagiae]|uniref:RNA polymerase sigma factor n=1 Tax=Chitinophaga alhagiae TaxID=2203219 RepID=UPI000E5AE5B8|nr:sigma-70 family RNA polymerase sigma factor [Chitinophaga alhagiae]
MHALTGNTPTDHHLVDQVLRGDVQAFSAIVRNTEALVAQIVCRMVKHVEDRKDLVQEIYLKAYQHLPGFRFRSKLSTWVGQIAYHTCINYLEKKKLLLPGEPEETALPGAEPPAAFLSRKELAGILQAAIERLPPIQQTIISLYHQQECSYDEITQITGLPAGTVKSYLFRARRALRDNLLLQYKKEEL